MAKDNVNLLKSKSLEELSKEYDRIKETAFLEHRDKILSVIRNEAKTRSDFNKVKKDFDL